jgi:hypothetical protein
MADITTILGTALMSDSRSTLNTNFSNLNSSKQEVLPNAAVVAKISEADGVPTWNGNDWPGSGIPGPQGEQGIQGEIGPQGIQGAVGPQGIQGIQGAVGPQGVKGDTGEIGPQGIQGPAGEVGPQGPQGPQGPVGPQGSAGPVGPQGPEGPQGPVGPGGPQGPAGADGAAGPQGLQGETGPEGPGLPTGGTVGQIITKSSSTDYDTQWSNPAVTREVLTENRTYFVRKDGNDSNTGLADNAGGAFLTIQKAVDTVSGIDCGVYAVTIQVRGGTYVENVALRPTLGRLRPHLLGSSANPETVIIQGTNVAAVSALAPLEWRINGFTLQATGTGSWDGVSAFGNSVIQVSNCRIGNCRHAIRASVGGYIRVDGAFELAGDTQLVLTPQSNGTLEFFPSSATISGNPTVTDFVSTTSNGVLIVNSGLTFANAGNVTGRRYSASFNGVINGTGNNINFFPGTTPGVTSSGGQYI